MESVVGRYDSSHLRALPPVAPSSRCHHGRVVVQSEGYLTFEAEPKTKHAKLCVGCRGETEGGKGKTEGERVCEGG